MIISDLNHLEVVEASVVGGISNLNASTNLNFNEAVNILKSIKSNVVISGNAAFAEADAIASGPNTVSQGLTNTVTTPYSSSSTATSVSASKKVSTTASNFK